jgi:hypothetical protein
MEQESIFSEPIEPDFSQPSRRDFLRITVTTAVATALLGEEEPAEAKETVDSFVETCSVESKLGKIDYPEKPKELTPEAKALILGIVDYQTSWLKSMGIYGAEVNDSNFEQLKRGTEQESQQEKEALWQKLRVCFPTLQQPTEKDYQRALIYDTPRYLAQFGVYARALPYLTFAPDLSRFTRTEVVMAFLQIGRKEHEELEREGKTIKRDVIYINGPLKIDGKDVNATTPVQANGQTHYQNILIYEYRVSDEDIGQNNPKIEQEAKQIQALNPDQVWQPIEKSADPRNMVLLLAMIKLCGRTGAIKEPFLTAKKKYIRAIIEHETGHLLDDQNPNFTKHFPLLNFTSPREYLAQRENREVHGEINATLYGLRYGNDQAGALRDIITVATREINQDFTHDQTASWIIDRFVEIIIKNPSRYGIALDPKRKVSPQNQIIAQLDLLLDRTELLNELTEQVMAIHNTRLDEDFSQEYFAYSGLEAKMQAAIAQNRAENRKVGLRWSAIGTALFSIGGGVLIHRIIKRKQTREKKETQKQKKGKKKK